MVVARPGRLTCSLSVGVATPHEGESLAAALERADAAMYASKRRRER